MEFPLPDDDIGRDNSASNATRASGSKRSFGDLGADEDDISGSKKGCTKVDEAATAMILSLRESLQNCQDDLASSQLELESAKTEVQKWKSAFEKESFVPARKSPEPSFVTDYIQTLRSSETSLKEQLEIAQMKLAIRDLKSQLEPAPMKEVDTLQEHGGTSCPSKDPFTEALLDELRAANALVKQMEEVQAVRLSALEKSVAQLAKQIGSYNNLGMLVQQKFPGLVPPSAPKDDD